MSQHHEKEYGLILTGKNKHKVPIAIGPLNRNKPSIFDEDSDSDGTERKPTGISRGLKRQERLMQEKAIEDDPTIFQYDELYDEMEQKRKDSKLSRRDLDKKPKYINKLLKAAEKRKLENERRIERQVQREREAEGNEYKDKESFVTSAYKKKLEEMKEQEELEKREEYLEAIGDVTKQGNLDGFYRHLYEQKINYDEEKEKNMQKIKTNVEVEESTNDEKEEQNRNKKETTGRKRQYRSKKQDSNSGASGDEEIQIGNVHLQSNLDADSDFSIDSDSDDEPEEKKRKSEGKSEETENGENRPSKDLEDSKDDLVDKDAGKVKEMNGNVKDSREETIIEEEELPKINIWEKRTVDHVFEAALQRYYERKSVRESG